MRALERKARTLADMLGEDHDLAELDALAGDRTSIGTAVADRRRELRRSAFTLGEQLHARRTRSKRLRRRIAAHTAWGTGKPS